MLRSSCYSKNLTLLCDSRARVPDSEFFAWKLNERGEDFRMLKFCGKSRNVCFKGFPVNRTSFSISASVFVNSSQGKWRNWEIDHMLYSNPQTRLQRSAHAELPPPLLSVAPMMEWTDNHFRYLARLLSRHTWLYTEMVVASTIVHQKDNLDRFLEFSEFQHPISLQIGGNDPAILAKAANLALPYGYDEINLNCGCPSNAVAGSGCFGASLMLKPRLVADCMNSIYDACRMPVTVKCRIGVDDVDNYESLCEFIQEISTNSPVNHFVIHARKALLNGLSPSENRSIPPLKYEYVFALMKDFPNLKFTLNGGVKSLPMAIDALERGVHGVMIGRSAYNSPWAILGDADRRVYGMNNPFTSRKHVLTEYARYADSSIGRYKPNRPNVRAFVKPLLNLFHGDANACVWRREIDRVLRHATTVNQVLDETLVVLPAEVLDAPPPLAPPDSPLSLPLAQHLSLPTPSTV